MTGGVKTQIIDQSWSSIEKWMNTHKVRNNKAQCPICRSEFKRTEVVILNFQMERKCDAVDSEIKRLKKVVANTRAESEKGLRIAKDQMLAAQLAESLVRADYDKLQGEQENWQAKCSSLETDLNEARRKLNDYATIIKRQQAKIRYLDFKTKEEGDEMAIAFISNFRSVSQADQDSLLQDLFHETRGSKKVLKSIQDNNALLRREVDRLNKKLVEAKCELDRMKCAHEGPHIKKRRISVSEELFQDPEWIEQFGGDEEDNSSQHIVQQLRQNQIKQENTKSSNPTQDAMFRRAHGKRLF